MYRSGTNLEFSMDNSVYTSTPNSSVSPLTIRADCRTHLYCKQVGTGVIRQGTCPELGKLLEVITSAYHYTYSHLAIHDEESEMRWKFQLL